jgi:uncharacterized membrane protein
MSKFVFIVFPNESKAYDGVRALRELHGEGSLTVYAAAVITKERSGNISVKQAEDQGPLGTAVGGLVGGLVGLAAGPAGAAIGLGSGALAGAMADLLNAGVQVDFLEAAADKLTPGRAAVIAEVMEDWDTPLDTRMGPLGGVVIRELRTDFSDAQMEMSMREWQAELTSLQADWDRAAEDQRARLRARIDEAQARLKEAARQTEERLRRTDQETEAKIRELQQQAIQLSGEVRSKVENRVAMLRAEQKRRSELLKQAWDLTKQALAA